MKRFLLGLLSFSLLSSSFAQVTSGFYRVKNADSGRYLYVYDNEGQAELQGANVIVDLDAIYLRADLQNAISNPGSIIYVSQHGSKYDFGAQGTSVYQIIGYYVDLVPTNGHYRVGATMHGVSAYLSDNKTSSSSGYGYISIESSGRKLWDAIPVSSDSENYFGINPTVSANSHHYASFYASFGISLGSSMKAYAVSAVCDHAVLLSEISGSVAPSTPVIIECSSSSTSDNKVDLQISGSRPSTNYLEGVYFDTDNSAVSYAVQTHINKTYTNSDMRVLGKTQSGQLAFVTTSLSSIPANTAYLEVESSAANELIVCFTQEEYDQYASSNPGTDPEPGPGTDPTPGTDPDPGPGTDPTPGKDPEPGPGTDPTPDSLNEIKNDLSNKTVYNLLGRKVECKGSLPAGIYIIDGKKTVIR